MRLSLIRQLSISSRIRAPSGVGVEKRSTVSSPHEAVILAACRTPIGSFRSQLASLHAPQLASVAIKACLEKTGVAPVDVQEVLLGQVCQAGVGQAPARQAALAAGLSVETAVTTVNKVCSSGLKSVMLAAQLIELNHQQLVLAGGMESMSQVPFYLARGETRYGGFKIEDGIVKDGLTDAYGDHIHMGNCAEKTAKEMNISREEQDEYAIESYKRSANAWESGVMSAEVTPIKVKGAAKGRAEVVVERDEEYTRIDLSRVSSLRPAFQQEGGTVTAANASTLNDGACALLLSSIERAKELGCRPMARLVCYGDAATNPVDFPVAPALVIPKLLATAGLSLDDIDMWEINEAFSLVPLAIMKKLGIPAAKVNIHGGAVSLGHPIGMSGARILAHLVHALQPGKFGLATICNGGGGASGMIVQKLAA